MRNIGRNVDEISRIGLVTEFQMISPPHACTTSDNINHGLQLAMMMWTSFSVRLNDDGTGPQLTGPGAGVRNGSGPCHTGGLGRIAVHVPRVHDLHAGFFPNQYSPPFPSRKLLLRRDCPSTWLASEQGVWPTHAPHQRLPIRRTFRR